jgi:hypothetical protein
MTNTSIWRTAHTCELGLPTAYVDGLGIAGRVASPRVRVEDIVMPITTGDVSLQADRAAVAGVAVKDAFPVSGLAWSPPI